MSDDEDDDEANSRPPTPREREIARVVVMSFAAVALCLTVRGFGLLLSGKRPENYTFTDEVAVTLSIIALVVVGLCCILAAVAAVMWLHWALTTPPSKPEGIDDEEWP
jgi:hypothetical protein